MKSVRSANASSVLSGKALVKSIESRSWSARLRSTSAYAHMLPGKARYQTRTRFCWLLAAFVLVSSCVCTCRQLHVCMMAAACPKLHALQMLCHLGYITRVVLPHEAIPLGTHHCDTGLNNFAILSQAPPRPGPAFHHAVSLSSSVHRCDLTCCRT